MLEELEVRNLGPIHQALLKPAPGMTAITGETGAGKSMLLNAIRLISGGVTRPDLVSPGSREAWVQGIFSLTHEAGVSELIQQAGLPSEGDQVFISRLVPTTGRSRAAVNGRMAPRTLLEDLASDMVTVHGQADQLKMANPGRQREFLDAYAQDQQELHDFKVAWSTYQTGKHHLESLLDQEAGLTAKADYLRESIERINQVNPHSGEDLELREQRNRIEHAAQISQGLRTALGVLDSAQDDSDVEVPSASGLIEEAISALEGIGVGGIFKESAQRLRSIHTDLADLVFTLNNEMDDSAGEDDLDKINARIYDLSELSKRWGPSLDDVLAWREQSRLDLEDMDASPEKLKELQEQCEQDRKEAIKAARALSKKRVKAGHDLSVKVTAELASLAMTGSSLDVVLTRVSEDDLDSNGLDHIDFLFTPYPGSPRLPIGKSASGGELSRLMLALELVAADSQELLKRNGQEEVPASPMTFIFDEVDAGVGGRAAVELGHRLARLSLSAQVIVVTHLPQVASWADTHFVVSKVDNHEKGEVETVVNQVRGGAREREIARMLAGSESKTSLEHARELLRSSRL